MHSSALITGATGGLGGAVAEVFLGAGWRVVAPYAAELPPDRLQARPAVAQAGERLATIEADLLDAGAVERVVELAAGDTAAPLGAVVNLVGGFSAPGRVHETPIEQFEQQFTLNLRPTYLTCAAALPHLLEAGGAIVCVSTRAAKRPFPGAAGYIASKGAVLAFVDALSAEYVQEGVRTNAVLPSVIDTPANRASQPDADHERWVAPEEIARVILFLCSPESAPVSGAHVPVYGRA